MIQVTNDWILKTLPNSDIQTPNSYTNAISCECFEALVDLSSNYTPTYNPKYIRSSTGLKLPIYQPSPEDVSRSWGVSSDEWKYFASGIDTTNHRGCRGRYDDYGVPTTSINLGYTDRYIDNDSWERKYNVAFASSLYGEEMPVKFKFFDPDTKSYKLLYLRYTQEYKNYLDDSTIDERQNKYRYSYFWEEENNTNPQKRTYIFESEHLNIMPGEHYTQQGYAVIAPPMYIYMYTDIGFDIINEKWVGLLNLFIHVGTNTSGRYVYINNDTITSDLTAYNISRINGTQSAIGPFTNISSTSYMAAVGAYSGLMNFYQRAFELEDFEPDIENVTIPITKIGCYGPNTRITS